MTVPAQDRPTDAVRNEVVDQLIMNYSHGVISQEAFERRLNIAMDSDDNLEIIKQAEDLDMKVDSRYMESKKASLGVKHASEPVEDKEVICNIFSSNDRSGRWAVPREIKLFSFFGGSNLDFTDAEFYHPRVTIKVICFFGGEKIYIPENVNVVSRAFAILGGVENSAPSVADRNAPTIVIEGTVICGSVGIKIKRTIKEKFQAFAENLRRMLHS